MFIINLGGIFFYSDNVSKYLSVIIFLMFLISFFSIFWYLNIKYNIFYITLFLFFWLLKMLSIFHWKFVPKKDILLLSCKSIIKVVDDNCYASSIVLSKINFWWFFLMKRSVLSKRLYRDDLFFSFLFCLFIGWFQNVIILITFLIEQIKNF